MYSVVRKKVTVVLSTSLAWMKISRNLAPPFFGKTLCIYLPTLPLQIRRCLLLPAEALLAVRVEVLARDPPAVVAAATAYTTEAVFFRRFLKSQSIKEK